MHDILTGEVNSGKSTRLWKYFLTNKDKQKISGWISLPYFEKDVKRGYDIVFIKESIASDRRILAREFEFEGGTKWRRFWFDEDRFKEAAEFDFGKPDLFLIDEIGPLELEEKKGFWPILAQIYEKYEDTITVIREGLVDSLSLTGLIDPMNCHIV